MLFRSEVLSQEYHGRPVRPPLFGLPISVKDLIDVADEPTTCGSGFYADIRAVPRRHAPFAHLWRTLGGCLAGKTHLNEFAYGITGENPRFGDCTIPGDPKRLTGGSSSGAAASVLGGAACIGLGTDTGGSLRVPAGLCGLVSFRSRDWFPDHSAVFPLAPSFDTLGWIQRHIGDFGFVARAIRPHLEPEPPSRIGFIGGPILDGCDPAVTKARTLFMTLFSEAGVVAEEVNLSGIDKAGEIFAPMQAHEAWLKHREMMEIHADHYSTPVLSRLEWGRGIKETRLIELEDARHTSVTSWSDAFNPHRLLVLPAMPVPALQAGEDQSTNRPRILKLTTPASLGCWPVLTLPWRPNGESTGIGFQVIALRGGEERLVGFAEWFSERFLHW